MAGFVVSASVPEKDFIPDVLADRYASAAMAAIWSPEGKVKAERRLWVAVLEAQRDLGIDVPDGAVEAYRSVIEQVDLDSIRERERITRHDVKARIEEFCALAGHEHIHKGMTSRDLTENIEQVQIRDSLLLVRDKLVAVVGAMGRQAESHAELVMVGRSHNVPAQATTLGKRFASYGEEALAAWGRIDDLLGRYRLRGLKGPVGTQQDQLDLLDGRCRPGGRPGAAHGRQPRLYGHDGQRGPGVSPVAGLRRGRRAGPGVVGAGPTWPGRSGSWPGRA